MFWHSLRPAGCFSGCFPSRTHQGSRWCAFPRYFGLRPRPAAYRTAGHGCYGQVVRNRPRTPALPSAHPGEHAMAFPSRPHTFALENCRNLLDKLKREIARLNGAASDDFDTHNDSAFNAAVTAWHLCDWVFADMTADQRDELKIHSVEEMREHARKQCRALHLCRQVATASKHWRVERYPDSKVKAITQRRTRYFR